MLCEPSFAPLSPSWLNDPQPYFEILRVTAPIYRSRELNCWVVSRHADVRRVLTDHRGFAADPRRAGRPLATSGDSVQAVDPPGNIALRRSLTGLLGGRPRLVSATEVRLLARRELDGLAATGGDLTAAIAAFSLGVICAALGMPVPPKQWLYPRSEAIVTAMDGGFRPEALSAAARAKVQISALIEDWLRTRPTPVARGELTGQLINSIRVIFHAGYTSLGRFLENAAVLLLTDPVGRAGYLRLSRAHRRCQALPELLRWTSTVQATTRFAVRPQLLAGEPISVGQPVIALIASGNWDSTVFTEPSRLDFERDCRRALTFGAGTHSCLGQEFAADCAEIFLSELLSDYGWQISGTSVRRDAATLRGWRTIPVVSSVTNLVSNA